MDEQALAEAQPGLGEERVVGGGEDLGDGARVTGTVRDAAAREQVAALGVQAIEPQDFVDYGPFDVILELVGAPNLPDDLRALAVNGRVCVIGVGAGARVELDLHVLMVKRARIHGSVLRARSLEEKAAAARLVERAVLPGFASGDLSVPVTAAFPLERVADAYDRFRSGGKLGKVVLELG